MSKTQYLQSTIKLGVLIIYEPLHSCVESQHSVLLTAEEERAMIRHGYEGK